MYVILYIDLIYKNLNEYLCIQFLKKHNCCIQMNMEKEAMFEMLHNYIKYQNTDY